MEDLIIITYNTNNYCTQSGDDSLGSIVDQLRSVWPHVLCLQVGCTRDMQNTIFGLLGTFWVSVLINVSKAWCGHYYQS